MPTPLELLLLDLTEQPPIVRPTPQQEDTYPRVPKEVWDRLFGVPAPQKESLFFPVILGGTAALTAGSSSTLVSYTVPSGSNFELYSLNVEAESDIANDSCTYDILIDGARVADASGIALDEWALAKDSAIPITLSEKKIIEISVKNNHASLTFTVKAIMVGRRSST